MEEEQAAAIECQEYSASDSCHCMTKQQHGDVHEDREIFIFQMQPRQ